MISTRWSIKLLGSCSRFVGSGVEVVRYMAAEAFFLSRCESDDVVAAEERLACVRDGTPEGATAAAMMMMMML